VGELLPSVLRELAESSGNARSLQPAWDFAVGPTISRNSAPVALEDGVLVVEVSTAAWVGELEQRRTEIRQRLCQLLGSTAISEVVFRSKR
jgi:predicted nucleic acid-binding Zn ribbon protein